MTMPIFGSRPIKQPDDEEETESEGFDWDDEHGHRVDRFFELGFDLFTALKLAIAKADWHRADEMLKQGATHEQVEQILS